MHKHAVFLSTATTDPIVPVCAECGKDLMVLYQETEAQLAEAISVLQESHKWLDFFANPKSRPKELQQMTIGECNRWIEAAVLSARAYLEKVKAS